MEIRLDLDLSELVKRSADARPHAIEKALEHIGEVADSQTPIEEGTLVHSRSVNEQGDEGSISFEGPYARYQHEKLDLRHEHGNAKFLEGPMVSEAATAMEIIADHLREAL